MVAETLPVRSPLPLLAEPLWPRDRVRPRGWRVLQKGGERNLKHDAVGALFQHMIVRYVVHGAMRKEIARETGYSERFVQDVVMGRTWESYTQAVVQELADLGISIRRGCRWHGPSRLREIVAAQERLLAETARLLDSNDRAASHRLRQRIRLLAAGKEPLSP